MQQGKRELAAKEHGGVRGRRPTARKCGGRGGPAGPAGLRDGALQASRPSRLLRKREGRDERRRRQEGHKSGEPHPAPGGHSLSAEPEVPGTMPVSGQARGTSAGRAGSAWGCDQGRALWLHGCVFRAPSLEQGQAHAAHRALRHGCSQGGPPAGPCPCAMGRNPIHCTDGPTAGKPHLPPSAGPGVVGGQG